MLLTDLVPLNIVVLILLPDAVEDVDISLVLLCGSANELELLSVALLDSIMTGVALASVVPVSVLLDEAGVVVASAVDGVLGTFAAKLLAMSCTDWHAVNPSCRA